MSDWDFLYEMNERGYGPEEIADAACSGAAPWEWEYIEKQERKTEWEKLKCLRDTGEISREELKKRKELRCPLKPVPGESGALRPDKVGKDAL
jgi:hypothetical protein